MMSTEAFTRLKVFIDSHSINMLTLTRGGCTTRSLWSASILCTDLTATLDVSLSLSSDAAGFNLDSAVKQIHVEDKISAVCVCDQSGRPLVMLRKAKWLKWMDVWGKSGCTGRRSDVF